MKKVVDVVAAGVISILLLSGFEGCCQISNVDEEDYKLCYDIENEEDNSRHAGGRYGGCGSERKGSGSNTFYFQN